MLYVKVFQIDLDRNVIKREIKVECFYVRFSAVMIEISKTKAAIVAHLPEVHNTVVEDFGHLSARDLCFSRLKIR